MVVRCKNALKHSIVVDSSWHVLIHDCCRTEPKLLWCIQAPWIQRKVSFVARRRIRFIDNICTSIIDSLDDWKSWLYTTFFPFVAHSRLNLFFNNWHYFFTTVIGNRRFAAEFLELFFEDYIRIRNCIGSFYWNSQAVFHKSKFENQEKNTLVHKLLHLFLPNLFCLQREDIQMEIQCLLTLSNPQDLLVKIRRLIQCPFIKSTILPSRRELQAITYKLNEDFKSKLTPRRYPLSSVLILLHLSDSLPAICITRPA